MLFASGGCSVLDLALVHVNTMGLMKGFSIKKKQPESNHAPIVITMDVGHERQQKGGTQVKPTNRVLQEKKGCYVKQLAHYLHESPLYHGRA